MLQELVDFGEYEKEKDVDNFRTHEWAELNSLEAFRAHAQRELDVMRQREVTEVQRE